ncbi:MAG TPA: GGDEF domain-containing protein [Clostridia bacterium]|nr:GGDEF domain-containing protein [Clostridia bacterium]
MFAGLFTSIKRAFSVCVPEKYKEEFEIAVHKINISRAKLTALTFVIIEVFVLSVSLAVKGRDLFKKPELYYGLMYIAFLAIMLVFLMIFIKLGKNITAHGKANTAAGVAFTCAALFWCAGISLLDQLSSGQVIVYSVAVLAISVAPYFKPAVFLAMYAGVHTIFLFLMPYFQKSEGLLYGNYINSTTFILISWAVSYMRYNKLVEDFNLKKLILEKNLELEHINKELAEANQKLEKLSQIDSLTGVFNRYMFDKTIKMEWNRCRRNFVPLSLIMIDIDFFKTYNDNHGHMVGDDCIKQVANMLTTFSKRSSDIVARYGGDEFALILPYMEKEGALLLAEQIRKSVEELGICSANTASKEFLTISAGVNSVVPTERISLEEFIEAADLALYKAKESRNSVFLT